jgi:hypothetical protein
LSLGSVMKLASWQSVETKQCWRLVRTDYYTEIKCNAIIAADEDTGECCIEIDGETVTRNYGPNGIRILPRGGTGVSSQ